MNPILYNLPQIIAWLSKKNSGTKNNSAIQAAVKKLSYSSNLMPMSHRTKLMAINGDDYIPDKDYLELENTLLPHTNAYTALSEKKQDTLDLMDKKYDLDANPITTLSKGKFRGVKVPKAIIDDAIIAAKKTNQSPEDLIGLMLQESTMGQEKGSFREGVSSQSGLVSGWDVSKEYQPHDVYRYLADKKVPGITMNKSSGSFYPSDAKAINAYLLKNKSVLDGYSKRLSKTKGIPKNSNILDLAAMYLSKRGMKGYNPGDKNYVADVMNSKQLMMQDPKMVAYLNKNKR